MPKRFSKSQGTAFDLSGRQITRPRGRPFDGSGLHLSCYLVQHASLQGEIFGALRLKMSANAGKFLGSDQLSARVTATNQSDCDGNAG